MEDTAKKIVMVIIGLLLTVALFVVVIGGGFISMFSSDGDNVSLVEIICNHAVVSTHYQSKSFEVTDKDGNTYNWVVKARDEVYEMKQANLETTWKTNTDDSEDVKVQTKRKKTMAIATLFYYWTSKNVSPVPSTFDVDWEEYAKCFTGDDFTASDYTYLNDKSFDNLSDYLSIELLPGRRQSIISTAKEIMDQLSDGALLDGYEENTELAGGSEECNALWNEILQTHNDNSGTLAGGCWKACGTSRMQCTDFASYMVWLDSDGAHGSAGGEGKNVARNLAKDYSNEYELIMSREIANYGTKVNGAIFSKLMPKNSLSSGHVGYINQVDVAANKIWISEGNVLTNVPGCNGNGIKINYTMSIDTFLEQKCPSGCEVAIRKAS